MSNEELHDYYLYVGIDLLKRYGEGKRPTRCLLDKAS